MSARRARGGRGAAGLLLVAALLAACDVNPPPEPTRPTPGRRSRRPFPPPDCRAGDAAGDGQGGLSIGASNPRRPRSPPRASLAGAATPTLAPTTPVLPMAISPRTAQRSRRSFYAARAHPAPAVLLVHQAGGSQQDWEPLIEPLRGAGYAVLTFDLRGSRRLRRRRGLGADVRRHAGRAPAAERAGRRGFPRGSC